MKAFISRFESVDSTNSEFSRLLSKRRNFSDGFAIYADTQLEGKGQVGNHWYDEAGKSILFSLLLHPDFMPVAEQFVLSEVASVGVVSALNAAFPGETFRVKWPNDIYYGEKKLAGILIENLLMGDQITHSIVGIGMNVNETTFPEDLPNPVSLAQITGAETNRMVLFCAIRKSILSEFEKLRESYEQSKEDLHQRYLASLFRYQENAKFADSNGEFEATIEAVEPSGKLCLRLADGECRRYYFKEVEYVLG